MPWRQLGRFRKRDKTVLGQGLSSNAMISHVDIIPGLLDFAGALDWATPAPRVRAPVLAAPPCPRNGPPDNPAMSSC